MDVSNARPLQVKAINQINQPKRTNCREAEGWVSGKSGQGKACAFWVRCLRKASRASQRRLLLTHSQSSP